MHTKDILAAELRKAGLEEMAAKAAAGQYHDYLSSLADPAMELDRDLVKAGTPEAKAIRSRHHNGEFDASTAESDEWAKSFEGRSAMRQLLRK